MPGREPVFTTVGLQFALVAADSSISSQQSVSLSAELETRLGAVPRNVTAMRVWLEGL